MLNKVDGPYVYEKLKKMEKMFNFFEDWHPSSRDMSRDIF